MYVDAVVLVNQGKEADGTDRTPTRWQVRVTGRTAENAANLRTGARLLVTGSVVADSWTDKQTGEVCYATRALVRPGGAACSRWTRKSGRMTDGGAKRRGCAAIMKGEAGPELITG